MPLTILERLQAERLTEDNGFGLPQGEVDGWLTFTGLACPLRLWIARRDGHWLIGLAHAGAMAEVAADAERLDVYNGLLLAAHLDAAFDAGLISFTDGGDMLVSPRLSANDRARLDLGSLPPLAGLKPAYLPFLEFHRGSVFQDQALS